MERPLFEKGEHVILADYVANELFADRMYRDDLFEIASAHQAYGEWYYDLSIPDDMGWNDALVVLQGVHERDLKSDDNIWKNVMSDDYIRFRD